MLKDVLYDYYSKLFERYSEEGKIKSIELIRSAESVEEALKIDAKYNSINFAARWMLYDLKDKINTVRKLASFLLWLDISVPAMPKEVRKIMGNK